MSLFPLKGKAVLITGASGGIGEALAAECASRGAELALASRSLPALKGLAKRLKGRAYALDVARPASVAACLRKVEKDFGRIDVLVNNAGVHMFSPVESMPLDMLKLAFEVNVYGPLRMIQAALPGMKRRGQGLIVQVESTLSYRSVELVGGYSASKAALMRLSEALRMELDGSGVKVLQVAPGVVKTALREHAFYIGPKPAPSASLPFARNAGETAREIADAMEDGRRDLMSAAWPVRLAMKYLSVLAPGWLDKRLKGRN